MALSKPAFSGFLNSLARQFIYLYIVKAYGGVTYTAGIYDICYTKALHPR